jgi:hypothetical protein
MPLERRDVPWLVGLALAVCIAIIVAVIIFGVRRD